MPEVALPQNCIGDALQHHAPAGTPVYLCGYLRLPPGEQKRCGKDQAPGGECGIGGGRHGDIVRTCSRYRSGGRMDLRSLFEAETETSKIREEECPGRTR